jgi:hypothetical protein
MGARSASKGSRLLALRAPIIGSFLPNRSVI